MTFRSALGLVERAKIDGEIYYKGERVKTLKDKLKNEIGYITQDVQNSLNPYIKVIDQMTSDLVFAKGISKAEAKEKALESLEAIGIKRDKAKKYPDEFSGGMISRAQIIRALLTEPKVLLADEITSPLDVNLKLKITELLDAYRKTHGMSVILVSHDVQLLEHVCDRVISINDIMVQDR